MNSRERAERIYTWVSDHETREAHCLKKIAAELDAVRNEVIEEAVKVLETYSNSCSDHNCCCGKYESLIRALKKPEGGER